MKVVVIGSGIAGLTAGAYLAQAGHEITILEQYPQAGGVTAPFQSDGYTWDLGQLIVEGLAPDEPLGAILSDLGVADKVKVRVEDRGYVFPDFKLEKPKEYQGVEWRMDRLKEIFPGEEAGLDRYWAGYLRFTSVMTLARQMERSSGLAAQYWKGRLFLKLLPLLSKKDWSAQQLMEHYFQSEKLQMVFTSILADFFTSPRKFPGLGVFALNPEASFDKRMPRELAKDMVQLFHYSVLGGIGSLVQALVDRIEALGGKVHIGRTVVKIEVNASRVAGVVDEEGTWTPADVVVASGGAKETFLKLVGSENLTAAFAGQVRGIPLMDSVFMVHLGLDFDPSPHVHGVCTYYYGTYDLDRGLADGRNGIYHEGRDGFVIHIPSLHTPEMAPPGHQAMTVYTICPDTLAQGNWNDLKETYADKLVEYAEQYIPKLASHVRVRHILTPEDWRARTHLDHHAFGGIRPEIESWRVPHRAPIEGLWFVGAQSESGGGINNVMPGAFKTARCIDRNAAAKTS